MERGKTIVIDPIFGWGWVAGETPRPDVPSPFRMKITRSEPALWEGVVEEPDHEFTGQRASITQRHTDWDGHVNVELRPADGGATSTGFGVVRDSI